MGRIDNRHLRDIRKKTPGFHEDLFESSEKAFARLYNEDAKCRIAAIVYCSRHWNLRTSEFIEICKKMAENDSDEAVRVSALYALGTVARASRDPAMSVFLANTVKRDNSSRIVRQAAYSALKEVQEGLTTDVRGERRVAILRSVLQLGRGLSEE